MDETKTHTKLNNKHYKYNDKEELNMRFLVNSKESSIIIGKSGKNIKNLRERCKVIAIISNPINGTLIRILTLIGKPEEIVKAFEIILSLLFENKETENIYYSYTVRLLIYHNMMGSIIGKQGARIKKLQNSTETRITCVKDFLPKSNERILEIQSKKQISILNCLTMVFNSISKELDKFVGTIYYNPEDGLESLNKLFSKIEIISFYDKSTNYKNNLDFNGENIPNKKQKIPSPLHIAIPADIVGLTIGKSGITIQNLSRVCNAKFSVQKNNNKLTNNSEHFNSLAIFGSDEEIEKGLLIFYWFLHYQLETKKQERVLYE